MPAPAPEPGRALTEPAGAPGPAPSSRGVVAGLATSVTLAALLTLAVLGPMDALIRADRALTDLTRGWADGLGWPVDLTATIGEVTRPAWSTIATALLTMLLLLARQRAAALFLASSALLGIAITEGTKLLVGRQRPPGAAAFAPDLDRSFPSGHSSAGIYLYMTAGLILLRLGTGRGIGWMAALGRVLMVVGPTIGVSRLILGVHWPSDVVAGWAFGSTATLACALALWDPLHHGWAGSAPATARRRPVGPGAT